MHSSWNRPVTFTSAARFDGLDSEELKHQHFSAVQAMSSWQEIWEIFHSNPWFRSKLGFCARKAAREIGLGADCYDDIQQQALIEFAKALQRNRSLGFDLSKGSFRGFLSTVIYRCCLKGLRQFQRRHHSMTSSNFLHPYYEEHLELEKLIDFRQISRQIPEPFRGVVRQLLAGESVGSIAKSRNRSKRTIYRWIDRSIALLRERYFQE